MTTALVIALAYALGAVPFSFLAARLVADTDIRKVGDENVGAANVFRHAGLVAGIAALAGDVGKGVLVVVAARWFGAGWLLVMLAGAAVVMGHNRTPMLRFRGGRGASPTAGVLFVLAPGGVVIAAGLTVAVFLATRSMTWSGFSLFAPVPLACWLLGAPLSLVGYTAALPCLVGLTHAVSVRHLPEGARRETGMLWVARGGDERARAYR